MMIIDNPGGRCGATLTDFTWRRSGAPSAAASSFTRKDEAKDVSAES